MEFRTAYGPKLQVNSNTSGPSRTKQAMRDECDVNVIIARHAKTGLITHLNRMEASYGNVVGMDFATAANIVADARSMFEALPSKVRKRFRNDPANFLDFVSNPANGSELVEMGLATKREVQDMQAQPGKAVDPAQPEATEPKT